MVDPPAAADFRVVAMVSVFRPGEPSNRGESPRVGGGRCFGTNNPGTFDPWLFDLERDPDGGLTLYLECEPPGDDRESNWLPAPDGPFQLVLRLYGPQPEALDGTWTEPPVMKIR